MKKRVGIPLIFYRFIGQQEYSIMITILRGRSVRVLWRGLPSLTRRAVDQAFLPMIGSFPLPSPLYRQRARPATHRKTEKKRELAERRGGGGSSKIVRWRESLFLSINRSILSALTPLIVPGGSLRHVVYLGWPIDPSYVSPNAGDRGMRGLSQWVRLWKWSPNKLWRSTCNSIFNLW